MADYPDFTISALLKGLYLGVPKALAVDSVGNMIAMLKGQYAGSPINLEADASGNIQINLVAQELSELINRFKYGAPDLDAIYKVVAAGATETVYELTGKGQIYTSYMTIDSTVAQQNNVIEIFLDGERITTQNYISLKVYNMVDHTKYPIALTEYNEVDYTYTVIMCVGYTFETSIEMTYYNASAVSVTVYGEVVYSVI